MAADVRLMSSGRIGLSEVAVGVPFPVAALEICRLRDAHIGDARGAGAEQHRYQSAAQRGWIDEVVAPDDLMARAVATARALAQHSPTAYAR